MRIGAARREDDFEINVISLIDVLLTLLMFFVMTTTFVQQARLKVSLPQASNPAEVPPQNALVIVVDRRGRYFVGGNEVLGQGVDPLKQAIAAVAGDDRSQPVILRADAETPNQAVVTAMDALGQLGFVHLALATAPAQGDRGR
ncbi:MAG TPA: biopolymer transporter ExbD [Rhodanobacteraceae bacterium]|nr:biopolymer transporter ExbD [Rhodanobacteraceae bacterium]